MKNLKISNFLAAIFVVWIVSNCKKEPVVAPPVVTPEPIHLTELGKVETKRDGQKTITDATMVLDDSTFNFTTDTRVVGGTHLEEFLFFNEVPFKKGKFSVSNYNYLRDGLIDISVYWLVIDELVGTLKTTENISEDFVEILAVDSVQQTVEGRFQFHVKNIYGTDLSPYGLPDSLHFTEGLFYVKAE